MEGLLSEHVAGYCTSANALMLGAIFWGSAKLLFSTKNNINNKNGFSISLLSLQPLFLKAKINH